jgi:alpha-amylase
MKNICLYFEVHQPYHLRLYRFFDIGNDHYYYDDSRNEAIIQELTNKCYLPATQMFIDMIKESKGSFHVAFSISGITLDLLEHYAPEVIDRFKELAASGCVEFLGEPYAHSLVSLRGDDEFEVQVKEHSSKIKSLFGQEPKVLSNTGLIYSNGIGLRALQMGFKGILTEGDKSFMGWHSPNYLYCCSSDPRLRIITRNSSLSNDITFRFSNWNWDQYPLTADKYIKWIAAEPKEEQVTSIFMNIETLGMQQSAESGIFDFFRALPKFAQTAGLEFKTPSEIIGELKPIDQLRFDNPISWADEERDVSAWLGNELQQEAFDKISSLGENVRMSQDPNLLQDWYRLQSSDQFFYMSTKHFANGSVHNSPFSSPYDAFINYMNALNDFRTRVNEQFPEDIDHDELEHLRRTLEEKDCIIEKFQKASESAKDGSGIISEIPKKKTVKSVSKKTASTVKTKSK